MLNLFVPTNTKSRRQATQEHRRTSERARRLARKCGSGERTWAGERGNADEHTRLLVGERGDAGESVRGSGERAWRRERAVSVLASERGSLSWTDISLCAEHLAMEGRVLLHPSLTWR